MFITPIKFSITSISCGIWWRYTYCSITMIICFTHEHNKSIHSKALCHKVYLLNYIKSTTTTKAPFSVHPHIHTDNTLYMGNGAKVCVYFYLSCTVKTNTSVQQILIKICRDTDTHVDEASYTIKFKKANYKQKYLT